MYFKRNAICYEIENAYCPGGEFPHFIIPIFMTEALSLERFLVEMTSSSTEKINHIKAAVQIQPCEPSIYSLLERDSSMDRS